MDSRSIVIVTAVFAAAVIGVFEWILCAAISRDSRMKERNVPKEETNRAAGSEGSCDRSWRRNHLQHWQAVSLLLAAYDILAVNVSFLFALWLRFDCRYSAVPAGYRGAFLRFTPVYTVFCLGTFWCLRLYKSIWRFAGLSELLRTLAAAGITGIFHTVGITVLHGRMPLSYYIIGVLVQFLLVLGIRFTYRFILLLHSHMGKSGGTSGKTGRVMLIGAGEAGRMIMRDIASSREINDRVFCIIDDNPNKWGRFVEGVPVAGGREDILLNVEKYHIEKIYMAIPTATAEQKRDILNICKETGCELRILPGIYQLVNNEVTVGKMKEVAIEDLLGREPIRTDMDEVYRFLSGKTVLVTGGGGSIGSELCRQIAGHGPKQLIIFDVYENNAYEIQLELKDKYPELDLVVLIGSVRDSRRLDQVFGEYRPEIVYHAAAHKHVPLMEDSPCEAVKNNTIGTYKTAYAAMTHGCRRFVLISTDKAVNPTNVMGASKRLCEMLIQTFDRKIREGKEEDLPVLFTHASGERLEERKQDEELRAAEREAAAACEDDDLMVEKEVSVFEGGDFSGKKASVCEATDFRKKRASMYENDGLSVKKRTFVSESSDIAEGKKDSSYGRDGRIEVKETAICKSEKQKEDPRKPRTEFVAVRFGNVLGSNGSVVPIFRRQIAKGGPVTVTHPDIIRYFMTIPEAVGLVLQAGVYAHGGEVFVLDMGSPVKIDTLARNLIKLSGYRPDVDIKIEYTGLRPGEKLYEEKLMAEENLGKSPNPWIHVGAPLEFDTERFLVQLKELMEAAYGNEEDIRRRVAEIVGTYRWKMDKGFDR